MVEFNPQMRKGALTIHVVCCGVWLGAAIAMMLLINLYGQDATSDDALATTWRTIKAIDDFVIIGAAGSSFCTGCIMSWGTKWGFLKWYWIVTKLLATSVMVAFGATCLGPWINRAAAMAVTQGVDAVIANEFRQAYWLVRVFGTIQIIVLLLIFGISIFKPWGKISNRSAV